MTVSVSDYVGVMGVEERNCKIPLIATAIALNASIVENWEGKDGLYGVEMGSKRFVVNAHDFDIANALAQEIKSRVIVIITAGIIITLCHEMIMPPIFNAPGKA